MKFGSFAEPEKADREFYKKLSDNERLQILEDRWFSALVLISISFLGLRR
jgi:hypothetical protein